MKNFCRRKIETIPTTGGVVPGVLISGYPWPRVASVTRHNKQRAYSTTRKTQGQYESPEKSTGAVCTISSVAAQNMNGAGSWVTGVTVHWPTWGAAPPESFKYRSTRDVIIATTACPDQEALKLSVHESTMRPLVSKD